MKTFRHSGKLGDIIFSLPTIRELGGGILYIPETTAESPRLYSNIKELLEIQPYIKEVREYPSNLPYMELAPGIHIDYDLDRARLQPLRGVIHIVKRYLNAFNVNLTEWKYPWLSLPNRVINWPDGVTEYSILNYTSRHIHNEQLNIKSRVDWKKVLASIEEPVFFIGGIDEYNFFINNFGKLPFISTGNLLELALLIRDAKAVYCNQSCVLALSQALGKEYYLDVKPYKTNCLLKTPNEHLL